MAGVCTCCGKNVGIIPFKCNGCHREFCVKCRLPETHTCDCMNDIKCDSLEKLRHKLNNAATIDTHHYTRI